MKSTISLKAALLLVIVGTTLGQIDLRTAKYDRDYVYWSYFEGACSSSWAIMPAVYLSDEINLSRGSNEVFSYQQILECCSACSAGYDNGCLGGDFVKAIDYLITTGTVLGGRSTDSPTWCNNYKLSFCTNDIDIFNRGFGPMCTESSYDISNVLDTCLPNACKPGSSAVPEKFKIYSKTQISPVGYLGNMVTTLSTTKKAIITEMLIYEDFYQIKSPSEVYMHTWGRHLGSMTVLIYGYNTDAATGLQYWIVKVPMGPGFGGDNSFIKVLKGVNMAGIENPGTGYYINILNLAGVVV